jgi:hypothetical protein
MDVAPVGLVHLNAWALSVDLEAFCRRLDCYVFSDIIKYCIPGDGQGGYGMLSDHEVMLALAAAAALPRFTGPAAKFRDAAEPKVNVPPKPRWRGRICSQLGDGAIPQAGERRILHE